MKTLKFQTKIDISKAPKKYQALLEELQLRQLLDVGVEQDIAEMNRSETGFAIIDKGSEAAGKFAHRLYQIARMVEAYNRVYYTNGQPYNQNIWIQSRSKSPDAVRLPSISRNEIGQ